MTQYIYIIFSPSYDRFYVGRSVDPHKRLAEHNEGKLEKYSGKAKDWEMAALFAVRGGSWEAEKAERFIKLQNSNAFIVKLLNPLYHPDGKLDVLVRVPVHQKGSL